MKNLAPIVLFVFNRPEHTLRTLQALQNNNLASQSTLHIFADGPKEGASEKHIRFVYAMVGHNLHYAIKPT